MTCSTWLEWSSVWEPWLAGSSCHIKLFNHLCLQFPHSLSIPVIYSIVIIISDSESVTAITRYQWLTDSFAWNQHQDSIVYKHVYNGCFLHASIICLPTRVFLTLPCCCKLLADDFELWAIEKTHSITQEGWDPADSLWAVEWTYLSWRPDLTFSELLSVLIMY